MENMGKEGCCCHRGDPSHRDELTRFGETVNNNENAGWSLLAGRWRGVLDIPHSAHPVTKLLTASAMPGHQ